jgi:hypothetical protein
MRKRLPLFVWLALSLLLAACQSGDAQKKTVKTDRMQMPLRVLQDKIKGGWAGQTIGVTFGGPYEFKYNGTFIHDYEPLVWYDGYIKKTMLEIPGLYDDLYMDLTFVDVIERLGIDAPIDSFSHAFAHAGYKLWHANQAARYNYLNGLRGHETGHWRNNPHADDIDYQIEADYAGLMSPGLPNAASEISDRVGHIMNYGDGWYGGVFVGALYAMAFVHDDIQTVVAEALKTIPAESNFHKCMKDVVEWHRQHPDDWHQTWLKIQRRWSNDIACPAGVFNAFNIDATVNSAYVLLGLLYGGGDYTKTLEISTRAGQDADCNPSTAAGILGTMLGYERIPAYWKMGLKESEDIDFKYTTISLNKAYEIGMKHALDNIKRNGGQLNDTTVTIALQQPKPVRMERSFPGIHPVEKRILEWPDNTKPLEFEFDGVGFALTDPRKRNDTSAHVFVADLYIDGVKAETARMPVDFTTRRLDFFWRYELPKGRHKVEVRLQNPPAKNHFRNLECFVYSDKPVEKKY